MSRIAIVDYGAGNLKSVRKALAYLGLESVVTADAAELNRADGLILPGVGAFPDAMERLTPLVPALRAFAASGRPYLGICLGMQLLFDRSEELRPCAGLGLIPGRVERIPTALKLPHIGWNSLSIRRDNALTTGLREGDRVYFVHSFCGLCDRETDAAAFTDYGVPVLAMTARGNLFGCQFHPEKSGEVGLTILRNFGGLCQ